MNRKDNTKQKKLTLRKETLRDLKVKKGSAVKGGGYTNLCATDAGCQTIKPNYNEILTVDFQ